MSIEFGSPQPGTGRQVIFVNGEKVGYVDPFASNSNDWRFHAAISLPVDAIDGSVLIQGFGVTKHDAVIDAIRRGQRKAADTLDEISVLEAKVFPRPEITEPSLSFGL